MVVPTPEGGADNDIPTPIPFADDSGTRAYRANVNICRTPTPRFPIWRFLFAAAALPPLLVFLAALAALIRWHMGIGFGAALSLVAVVGFVVLAWVVCSRSWRWLRAGGGASGRGRNDTPPGLP